MIKSLTRPALSLFKPGKNQSLLQLTILGAILVIASVLRFYKLGMWSFWSDEIFSISRLEDGFNFSIFRQSLAINLIRAATTWLGTSEWSARLVPAAIGTLTIPALYFPCKKLGGPWVALTASAMLAVSPWHLYWSQNARFYSLLFLLYNLGLLIFFIGVEENRQTYLAGSLILFGLAARESLVTLFIAPVVFVYILLLYFLHRDSPGIRWQKIWLFIIPGAILGLSFAWPYLNNLGAWLSAFSRVNNTPFWLLSGTIYYTGLPTIMIACLGALYFLPEKNRMVLMMAVSALLPLFLLMGIASFHYTANRYIFMTLFSWIFLAALTAIKIFEDLAPRSVLLGSAALLIVLGSSLSDDLLYYQYQNGNRADWKSAFEYVNDHLETGDIVVSSDQLLGDFYLPYETVILANWNLQQTANAKRIWFVEDMTVQERWPDKLSWIEANAQLYAVFDVNVNARTFKMRVYRYDVGHSDQVSEGISQ